MKTDLDVSVTGFSPDQLAEALTAPGVNIHYALDLGDLRCHVCSGDTEGRFLAFQSGATGHGFVVQQAEIGNSIHDAVREAIAEPT
ncbi:MAG: hypothetical protein M9919_13720 [Burkholderiaceae bacterium]|nr:hypothetical protein [Burkholderiaceae bacterium]